MIVAAGLRLAQAADFNCPSALPVESLLGRGLRPVSVGQSNVGAWVKCASAPTQGFISPQPAVKAASLQWQCVALNHAEVYVGLARQRRRVEIVKNGGPFDHAKAGAFMGYAIGSLLTDQQRGETRMRLSISRQEVVAHWTF